MNSNSAGSLNYAEYEKTGLSVIAVGGLSLSRGLTLEGLTVSYFLRNSMMYDTLMQMGRWFGFRPNYDDLCRIWMPEEAEGWYAHIAESIEMLREELRTMEAAGSTPEEFGLRVRSDPDTLIVTARNKMGSGEKVVVQIGLNNRFIETTTLRRGGDDARHNLEAARDFASRLAKSGVDIAGAEKVSSSWLIRDVPADPVIEFVSAFRNHPGSMLTETGPVLKYINDRRNSELASWDIVFAGIGKADKAIFDDSLGRPIYCQRRTPGKLSNADTLHISDNQRVASRGAERLGVRPEAIQEAERKYRKKLAIDDDQTSVNYPDRIYRPSRDHPLLIIHLLTILSRDEPTPLNDESEPVVAYSISFPKSTKEEKRVEYVVNTTWLRESYQYAFELDDDDH